MLFHGTVKNIRTKSKAEDEGNVVHITTITAEFEDLDQPMLEELAFAEHLGRSLTMEVHARTVRPTIGE